MSLTLKFIPKYPVRKVRGKKTIVVIVRDRMMSFCRLLSVLKIRLIRLSDKTLIESMFSVFALTGKLVKQKCCVTETYYDLPHRPNILIDCYVWT